MLMFRKVDLPSSKKEEKLRCCLFGLILKQMVHPFDGF
jgi:hypothetical protein